MTKLIAPVLSFALLVPSAGVWGHPAGNHTQLFADLNTALSAFQRLVPNKTAYIELLRTPSLQRSLFVNLPFTSSWIGPQDRRMADGLAWFSIDSMLVDSASRECRLDMTSGHLHRCLRDNLTRLRQVAAEHRRFSEIRWAEQLLSYTQVQL
ncbi:hypothetical protein [Gloeobacter kilaueensis]|uniref:Uncharacterized protein n=1 Tax=Gloeobacter kilaueensis (strain ATCC BAA-2537 / CCAP 1431/1 / ULC 316 / JS1) TaxID=1183438 RepID=U5QNF0_GLOK1|nr:hypothetical protein [Gloeobacter kilaueensis]AGY60451.1 hypothetical protein GKIL_4205 [Gloeobacter kilaueensis JS1]